MIVASSPELAQLARLDRRTSHAVFMTLLRSLAEPGTVRDLPQLDASLFAGVLALADVDATFSVDDEIDHPVVSTLAAVTGSRPVAIADADLVVLTNGLELLDKVGRGSALRPEDGARLFLPVTSFDGAPVVDLSGPGVPGRRRLAASGIGVDDLLRLGDASGAFPCGIDTWLIDPHGSVVGLPRTTTITTTMTMEEVR
jgi:alpha-D-ribose 1-methylphosphonate 5-triphosphate synthase subunit PhnH